MICRFGGNDISFVFGGCSVASAKVAKGAVARLTPICLFRSPKVILLVGRSGTAVGWMMSEG